ncbi:MAG: hypothetical protein A3G02_00310 [Candidatus Yanofskybacteria bacterium RIFCSPLOWO2_12_FULL_44_13b]|uniref:Uncharacterized protein n=2 Tax=Candidatus Yanofskyibacteriota TaxID=1752733 RepID=A0A1F8H0T6_9BACT|nr:MAG: hypothetical protein UW14_C0013G0023 [Candidatus Yanofskybacteria bacterium GW2011_GWA2_44_10]KKT90393.1 MAG: hypothetical protein UW90_C0002G0042 [Candidatus Yanofskybacteria bacterium GW2011_GWB1_45_11]OGN02976.1 MAG: hypothetical protein A2657_01155 [Candidatus Yanofskybacteria bacterium RIFCSPHIGHO2_01_FULL_44_110b]OGN15188.1 MAG: hypothetical protein A3C01_01980 [Candidatus Yanofskybacteria bacterium RIFCSPHIGHO2_02_FULL_44_36b]OGN18466.1 MAG: hypothetical protein A3F50_01570 [Cand
MFFKKDPPPQFPMTIPREILNFALQDALVYMRAVDSGVATVEAMGKTIWGRHLANQPECLEFYSFILWRASKRQPNDQKRMLAAIGLVYSAFIHTLNNRFPLDLLNKPRFTSFLDTKDCTQGNRSIDVMLLTTINLDIAKYCGDIFNSFESSDAEYETRCIIKFLLDAVKQVII